MNFMIVCDDIAPIIKFIKIIFNLIQIVIPIGLIIMGSIDLGKAVLSSDDKEIKAATGKLVKRAIAAVAIFFLVLIVKLIMNTVSDSSTSGADKDESSLNWITCWDNANTDD